MSKKENWKEKGEGKEEDEEKFEVRMVKTFLVEAENERKAVNRAQELQGLQGYDYEVKRTSNQNGGKR